MGGALGRVVDPAEYLGAGHACVGARHAGSVGGAAVGGDGEFGAAVPGELGGVGAAGGEGGEVGGAVEGGGECRGHGVAVAEGDQGGVAAGDFAEGGDVGADDGDVAGHGLEDGQAEAFVAGGEDESGGTGHDAAEVDVGEVADGADPVRDADVAGADEDQGRQVGGHLVGFEQPVEGLAGAGGADEEQVLAGEADPAGQGFARGAGGEPRRVHAEGGDGDLVGGDLEAFDHGVGDGLGRGAHHGGAAGGKPDQPRPPGVGGGAVLWGGGGGEGLHGQDTRRAGGGRV